MQKTLTVISFLLFCSTYGSAGDSKLVISVPSEFDSIDPTKAWSYFQHLVINAHCSTLTRLSARGETVGHLLESWRIDPDLRAYHFKLRDKIKMHDGTRLESKDVIYSFSRHFWPQEGSNYKDHLSNAFGRQSLKNGEMLGNFKEIDKLHFKVVLPRPYLPFLTMLSQSGLCVVKNGAPYVSMGPFQASYDSSQKRWLLKRHEQFFLEPPHFNQISVESELNGERALSMLKEGAVDVVIGNHLREIASESQPGLQVLKIKSLSFNHFLVNTDEGRPLKDLRLRALIGQILQIIAWQKKSMGPFESPQETIIPRGLLPDPYYQRPPRATSLNLLLKELSSYKRNLEKPIHIVLVGRDHSTHFVKALLDAFARADFPVKVQELAGPDYLQTLKRRSFDVISYGFLNAFADPDGFLINFEALMKDGGPSNGLISHDLRARVDKLRHLTEKSHRSLAYAELYRELESYWVMIPIYRTFYPILSRQELYLPETSFLNSFEIWQIHVRTREESKTRK